MTCTYQITAGSTVESLSADPTLAAGRAAVMDAVRRVQDREPKARLRVSYRLAGPVHVSEPINKILAEIQAAHDARMQEARR